MTNMSPGQYRYRKYKSSHVEWLGEIPYHWTIRRLKFIAKIKTGEKDTVHRVENGAYPFFIRSPNVQRIDTYSFDGEAVLTAGDGDIGKIFHYVNGKFDYHQRVYKFSNFSSAYAKYVYYYLHYNLAEEVIKLSAKTTVDSLRLPYLQNFPVALPSIEEQLAICSLLDRKVAEIDQAIAIKQRQINLLKERKQILIQNAVTRGLDPNAPMRHSGVEWIGEIPEHWSVKRAKYLFQEVDERSSTGEEELLSVSHTTGVTPRSEKNVNMFMAEDYTGSKTCQKDDLVINIMWAWMGAMGVSDRSGIVSSSYGIFRQIEKDTFNPKYLEMLLKTTGYIEHYNKVSTGLHSSRLRFYAHMFMAMELGYPEKQEQDSIVGHIDSESEKLNKSSSLLEQQIIRLKEYKATLINSAVTGKIKVPGVVEPGSETSEVA